jgi:uncharacterized hydrophobic protein (TIGR00271 family)
MKHNTFWHLLNLHRDQDDPAEIDKDMRASSEPVGANLWILIFAILIASVGLNVNSTAVIVGAMLISPLMGPILAIGYGAAVHDLLLIRQAGKTLVIFALISLVTSTLYFALSPLDQPGTELLARTTPTLWDVLIAAFGGAAGMIAATRKDISNVVPGVAIATALMPPLCTAGFGLAQGRWDIFGGAIYLFIINGVFIAAATLAISKLLQLPRRGMVDEGTRFWHRIIIGLGIFVVLTPSVWLGYRFVQREVFVSGVKMVAQHIESNPQFNVVGHQIDPVRRILHLTVVGNFDEPRLQDLSKALLLREGLANAKVEIRRVGDAPVDVKLLRSQLKQDVDNTLVQQLQITEKKVHQIETQLTQLSAAQAQAQEQQALAQKQLQEQPPIVQAESLYKEAQAQFVQVVALTLAFGNKATASETSTDNTAVVVVELSKALSRTERASLQRWLAVRLAQPNIQLIEQLQPQRRRQ